MGLITLHNFTMLDIVNREAYLERHPEDTRFAPDTIGDMYPEFTQEYLETLRGMWPSWDEDHEKSWRTLAYERTDLDITDRLFREGFTEFEHTPGADTAGRPRPYNIRLYDDPYPSVRLLRAKNPETGKTADYQYVNTANGNKWVNETKLARETRAADEMRQYIAGRLENLLALGENPGPQTLQQDARNMVTATARSFMSRMYPDAYRTVNGFFAEFSEGDLADLVKGMSYDKKVRFITDAAHLYGVMEDEYTLGGFAAKINLRLDDIFHNIKMHEIMRCGKQRQEDEMSRFMNDPHEIRKMLRYPGSSTNMGYVSSFFYDVLAAEAVRPGRTLTSIMNPRFPAYGFLDNPVAFSEAVRTLLDTGRKEEVGDYINNFVAAVLHHHYADRHGAWLPEHLLGKIEADIAGDTLAYRAGSFRLDCLRDTIRAAARPDFTREEVEKAVEVCLRDPDPGFYGYKTATLAEYIAEQDDDAARAIISSESPGKEAGIMRARTYIEWKIQQIQKDEAAAEKAEYVGDDILAINERLTRRKENLAWYIDRRLNSMDEEHLDRIISPQDQEFVLRFCGENSENWTLSSCRKVLEHFQDVNAAQDSCIYQDHGIAVYMAEGKDADRVSVVTPYTDFRLDAAVTLDTSTGHVYAAYRDSDHIPEGTQFEEMSRGPLMYRVDMTQALGGPASQKDCVSKVVKSARTVMENICPATESLSRMNEVVEMGRDLTETMRDILREERAHELTCDRG